MPRYTEGHLPCPGALCQSKTKDEKWGSDGLSKSLKVIVWDMVEPRFEGHNWRKGSEFVRRHLFFLCKQEVEVWEGRNNGAPLENPEGLLSSHRKPLEKKTRLT